MTEERLVVLQLWTSDPPVESQSLVVRPLLAASPRREHLRPGSAMPPPGVLRRERRTRSRHAEERLRDLGGLMLEMYRRDQFREDLLLGALRRAPGDRRAPARARSMLAAARRGAPRPDAARAARRSRGLALLPELRPPVGRCAVVACAECGHALPGDARLLRRLRSADRGRRPENRGERRRPPPVDETGETVRLDACPACGAASSRTRSTASPAALASSPRGCGCRRARLGGRSVAIRATGSGRRACHSLVAAAGDRRGNRLDAAHAQRRRRDADRGRRRSRRARRPPVEPTAVRPRRDRSRPDADDVHHRAQASGA